MHLATKTAQCWWHYPTKYAGMQIKHVVIFFLSTDKRKNDNAVCPFPPSERRRRFPVLHCDNDQRCQPFTYLVTLAGCYWQKEMSADTKHIGYVHCIYRIARTCFRVSQYTTTIWESNYSLLLETHIESTVTHISRFLFSCCCCYEKTLRAVRHPSDLVTGF